MSPIVSPSRISSIFLGAFDAVAFYAVLAWAHAKLWWKYEAFRWWDEWRGSLDGRPVMYIKRVIRIPVGWSFKRRKLLSIRVDLHKMVRADDLGCLHSHPAWAIRVPFFGGYVEEYAIEQVFDGYRYSVLYKRLWSPLSIGVISPRFVHRVHALLNGRCSYSLWIRGPIVADVELVGPGWPADKRGTHPERN